MYSMRHSFSLLLVCSWGATACEQRTYNLSLQHPCEAQMSVSAPSQFSILFRSNYGDFTAHCERQRAPVWVDRIYNLVLNGYYNSNYFFRVIDDFVVQFGTNGDPKLSNVYNWNSSQLGTCAILEPQPPYMPVNEGIPGLSNVFGTLAMSTSYNETTETTWNATAELFINLGNNSYLDDMLFVPVCTIDPSDMERTVLRYPSFGEVEELGGTGPSLDALYAEGNAYIESNPEWDSMGITTDVSLSCYTDDSNDHSSHDCGPCLSSSATLQSAAYRDFSFEKNSWTCPPAFPIDSCATKE